MKLWKSLVSAAMALTMVGAVVPASTSAFTVTTDISPARVVESADLSQDAENFDTVEAAVRYVRECIRTRDTEFVYSLPASLDYEKSFDEVMLGAVEETYNADEGDYIKYDINSVYCTGKYDGVSYYYYITMKYYTTTAQEQYVDKRVEQIISSLDLENKDDYGKICAIYEYIINNVGYDYSEDENNKERFSAYGALHNGKAVCQGFSQLFYRLAKEVGIPCRIISGTADGGHAWNIVAVDGIYYLVDSTWDIFSDDISQCDYFMKGSLDFDEADRTTPHVASGENPDNFIITDFTTDEFKAAYPIADYAFDVNNRQKGYTLGDVNNDGVVDSADASEILSAYANLSIYGVSYISAAQELAADLNNDDTIDSTDASVIMEYYSYVSTGGTIPLTDYLKKVK